ncbi:hypothetical protein [Methylobacterium sp. J-070]|uniref:hypothetical protein n=1 Tax=Methylobacterium sp. J-070 TaxID=2836650 RepID=UPI001FB8B168|nr:hypothetical protein [Methylobacterium sp. J-070]MCJ2053281.1 hypothetical protein [Methylobacterium sp. J-070]
MAALFASGRIIDGILALVVLEALLLVWLCRRRRVVPGVFADLSLPALLATLASGAALMLALRAALVGAPWSTVAACLLAGLVAHLADLGVRIRAGMAHRRRPPPTGTTPRTEAFTRVSTF